MEEDSTSAIEAEIGGAGDDFSVDELLDFSNGYSDTEEQKLEETELKPSPLIPEKEEAAFPENDLGEICFQVQLISIFISASSEIIIVNRGFEIGGELIGN